MRRTIKKSIFLNAVGPDLADELEELLPDESVWLSIDSRTIEQGDIFFAIKGEFADGHDHIAEACKKGASLVITNRETEYFNVPVIEVNDSLKFFSELACAHLQFLDVIRIGITGSNGKTTTKEMVKASLKQIFGNDEVYASEGNQNNHFGIPLSALEVKPSHKVAIFEMGMNNPGEITSHCAIIKPQFGIITNISYAHGGNFSDGIEGVMKAKGELFDFLSSSGGTGIANLDDERVRLLLQKIDLKTITFGHSNLADVRILGQKPYSIECKAQEINLSIRGEELSFLVPILGPHHAQNAASALALVLALGQDVKKASLGILSMKQTLGRMSISQNPRGCLLINDGYNANPSSMKAGILASLELKAKRRIAVIGAMGELGEESPNCHFSLGELLASHFDHLFICGKDAINTVEGATNAGFPKEKIVYAQTSIELVNPLRDYLAKGDLVFIKGSLSANMKAIAESLADY